MRRLWITRRKALAACFAKMKVYIEDPEGETLINGVPCRKLGELKNGRKMMFSIGENALRLFVVGDVLFRNQFHEFLDLPAGEEDVTLSGKNIMKPYSGNPFRFDGPETEAVRENRKQASNRGKKIVAGALLAGILLGTAVNFSALSFLMRNGRTPPEKDFSVGELQITLTEEFMQTDVPGYTACFSSGETAVFVLREDMEQMKPYGNPSLEVYGAMVLANNGFDQSIQLQKGQRLTTFDALLMQPETGDAYYYYCGLFRSEDAYWMVQITTMENEPEELVPLFRKWLMSVSFMK